MKLKIIENFESDFVLDPQVQETLTALLQGPKFLQQIADELGCLQVEFTGLLFQPVPYSIQTPKGMPRQFEPYHQNQDYAIINVPANFMFTAKVFKPSRLCAIYRKYPLQNC